MILLFGMGVILAFATAGTARADSGVVGEAELKYIDYTSRTQKAGLDSYTADSFSQHYSLGYFKSTRDPYRAPRPLEYSILAGYEWASLDTSIQRNDSTLADISMKDGRLFYRGEIAYDPPTMPLTFKAFANDIGRVTSSSSSGIYVQNTIFEPELPVTITSEGTHLRTGATLTLGEKAGLNRKYDSLFKHIPLLMIDYSEEVNKEDSIDVHIDNRTRKLAFVSLNKKDNWFHYRTEKYEDFLAPSANWRRTEYQLGTVDENLSRKWVDLTNWIAISADGQFTRFQAHDKANDYDNYALNLFTVATRKTWQVRNYSTFLRRADITGISTERTIPLYLSGIWGAETDWSARVYFKDHQIAGPNNTGLTMDEETRAVSLRATTYKRSQFTISPSLSVSQTTQLNGKSLDMLGSVEAVSTRRFSSQHDLALRYEANVFFTDIVGSQTSDYLKQTINGRWGYFISDRLRFSLNQVVALSNTLNDSTASSQNFQSNYNHSQFDTRAMLSWVPNARSTISMLASNELSSYSDEGTLSRQAASISADYKLAEFSGTLNLYADNVQRPDGVRTNSQGISAYFVYNPRRHITSQVNGRYEYRQDAGLDYTFADITQKARYDVYGASFSGRPLVELEEEFHYTSATNSLDSGSLRISGRYYPFSRVTMGGSAMFNVIGFGQQVYSANLGLNLKYFQSNVEYSYGKRSYDQRVDKRLAATVRRSF